MPNDKVHIAIIGVGSNIEPRQNIKQAKKLLSENHIILKESRFLTTKPIGFLDQPDFINGAWLVKTCSDKLALESSLKGIERTLGRDQSQPSFGPRTIDLDILVWDNQVVSKDFERSFVRKAVFELLPNLRKAYSKR